MAERWITWRGRHILVDDNGKIIKSNQVKELKRKDLVKETYIGADGYFNIELKKGYTSPDGLPYIWAKTKKEAYEILDSVVAGENKMMNK